MSEIHEKRILKKIQKEVNELIKNHLSEINEPISEEKPFKWEDEYGRYEYKGGETACFIPKKSADYVNIDIEIKPTKKEVEVNFEKELDDDFLLVYKLGFSNGLKDAYEALNMFIDRKSEEIKNKNNKDLFPFINKEKQYITRNELEVFMETYIGEYKKSNKLEE